MDKPLNEPLLGFADCDFLVHERIEAQAIATPKAIALEFQSTRLTYQDLNHKSNQIAHHLQQSGIQPGSLIGVALPRSPLLFVTLIGILKAGAAYLPLDPEYPSDRLNAMLSDAGADMILSQGYVCANFEGRVVDLDQISLDEYPSSKVQATVRPDDRAYVIYTSGSTGTPKGVQIRHRSVVNLLKSLAQTPGCTASDRMLCLSSISFDMSVPELFLPLTVGGCIVLVSRELATDPLQLARVLRERQITIMQATPTLYNLLVQSGWQGQDDLALWCGGEALTPALAESLLQRSQVWNLYGPTETTVWSSAYKVEFDRPCNRLGEPIANTQFYILPTGEEPIPAHLNPPQTGELCIGGAGVALGYLNRPDLTAERFISNPNNPLDSGDRLYKTGDLARAHPDGSVELLGRRDHQVKIRGHRVELGEIEAILSQHPHLQAGVVAAHSDSGLPEIVAYCVPKEASANTVTQWQALWDAAYTQDSERNQFNISGLNSSYTRQQFPQAELEEWSQHTARFLQTLKPQSVLEIGCGTGLLLFQLLPHCQSYTGIDPAPTALEHIRSQLQSDSVTLHQLGAHELDQLQPQKFDTIILNSVAQYFPSISYLLDTIASALNLLAPGGNFFIGDVRSLPLLRLFHTSVQLAHAPDDLSPVELQQRIEEAIAADPELVIDPKFFQVLPQRFPQINQVSISVKPGRSHNELVCFRYDCVLTVNASAPIQNCLDIVWNWSDNVSLTTVEKSLREQTFNTLKISNIPNARLQPIWRVQNSLSSADSLPALKQLCATAVGVELDDWQQLGNITGYQTYITWSQQYQEQGNYDVVFYKMGTSIPGSETQRLCDRSSNFETWKHYSNTPVPAAANSTLIPELRRFLQEQLPSYMMPTAYVVLKALPLTPTGKIDRQALPRSHRTRSAIDRAYVPPSTPLQAQLAQIWSQVLGLNPIGVNDSFLELGGHSLLAVQLIAEIEGQLQLQQQVSVRDLLQNPTIAQLAQWLEQPRKSFDPAILTPRLNPAIQIQKPQSTSRSTHILLTGATGFIGAFLLIELLKQPELTVECLVRATNLTQARHNLERNLDRYQLELTEADWSRIQLLVGDLSEPCFGLEAHTFDQLAARVTRIYHVGAKVNLLYSYRDLHAANVAGTETVLRLASLHTTPVHLISSLDVFQCDRADANCTKSNLLIGATDFSTGYAQSKWAAEQLALAARDRGLPVSIYRLGHITGHSQTGVGQSDDLLARFIHSAYLEGISPVCHGAIALTPVEFVSRALVFLSQPNHPQGIYHLINPQAMPAQEWINAIQTWGDVRSLGYSQWHQQIREHLNPLHPLFPVASLLSEAYLEASLFHHQQFNCQITASVLQTASITCPPTIELLECYIKFLLKDSLPGLPQLNVRMQSALPCP